MDSSTTIIGEPLQEERGPILGQIDPGVGVLHRGKSTILPKEGSVLLQETFERTTAGATIEPDGDLIASKRVRGREKPEVQFACLVGSGGDGEKTGIRFSNVKIHVGNRGAVDDEFFRRKGQLAALSHEEFRFITL